VEVKIKTIIRVRFNLRWPTKDGQAGEVTGEQKVAALREFGL
jgi:hypothetical protein